ncbi:MAG TPA: DUF3570 domain-containing protein [Kofleriaceae bacterium]|nr:DUF3570 domain-containing protein [Kofleriaceae bacterium]
MIRAIAIVAVLAGIARADGEVSVRGVYYKEHATRVEQPMIDARFDAGDGGSVDAHFLVDAITSASPGSGAANMPFTEKRYELGGGFTQQLEDHPIRWGVLARASVEPDYESGFFGGRFEHDFADKNFTFALAGGIGYDHITNAGAQFAGPGFTAISEHLSNTLLSGSITQVLGKNTVGSLTYDFAYFWGYLANPYRTVITADAGLVPERMPDYRARHAFAGIVRHFLPSTATTLIAAYRLYTDDWGMLSHTPEVRVVQAAGDDLEVGLGFRYYHQSGASFFKPVYPTVQPQFEPYLTDDPKLSPFDGETITARFAVLGRAFGFEGNWGDARAEVIVEYVVQHNRFGNAGIGHVALTVPFSD